MYIPRKENKYKGKKIGKSVRKLLYMSARNEGIIFTVLHKTGK